MIVLGPQFCDLELAVRSPVCERAMRSLELLYCCTLPSQPVAKRRATSPRVADQLTRRPCGADQNQNAPQKRSRVAFRAILEGAAFVENIFHLTPSRQSV